MTARKGDIKSQYYKQQDHIWLHKTIQDYRRSYEATKGHERPCKINRSHIRPHTAMQYHNVPQKIALCLYCVSMNFIFTQRNIFYTKCTFFVPLHTFCSIWNIFPSCFKAQKNNKNNKASFRTFERQK